MSEAIIKELVVCDDCGGTLTDGDLFSMALGEERAHYWHMDQSGCIASLNERLTLATERAEAAEAERHRLAEKWGSMVDDHGDPLDAPAIAEYVCIIREELSHMTAERDALRKDAARLDWLADTVAIEGFGIDDVDAAAGSIGMDIYEHASIVADERGNDDDPTVSDQREGLRRMIDAAMGVQP